MKAIVKILIVCFVHLQLITAQTPTLTINSGHKSDIYCMALSADEKYAVTGGADNTVKLWDLANQKVIRNFEGHTDCVTQVAISTDNTLLISASKDQTLRVWDLATGKLLRLIPGNKNENFFTLLPDNKTLVHGTPDSDIAFTDITQDSDNGLKELVIPLAPDAKTIREIEDYDEHTAYAHTSDGATVLAAASFNIKVIDAATGKMKILKKEIGAKFIAISPDNRFFATSDLNQTVKIYDLKKEKLLQTITGFEGDIKSLSFSPDSQHLLAAYPSGTVYMINVASAQIVRKFAVQSSYFLYMPVQFLKNGYEFILATGGGLQLWNLEIDQPIKMISPPVTLINSFAFAPNAEQIAIALGDTVAVFSSNSLNKTIKFSKHQMPYALRFSNDNSKLAFLQYKGNLKIINPKTGDVFSEIPTGEKGFINLAFSPDSRRIATTDNESMKIWIAETGKMLKEFKLEGLYCIEMRFTPDGKEIIASVSDRSIRTFSIETGAEIRKITIDREISLYDISADGKMGLMLGFEYMQTIDLETGKPIAYGNGHKYWLNTGKLSPDGKLAVTAGKDQTILVWDTKTGKKLHKITKKADEVYDLGFTPDGKKIVSRNQKGEVSFWDLSKKSGDELDILEEGLYYIGSVYTGKANNEIVFATPDGRFAGTDNSFGSMYLVNGFEFVDLESLYDQLYTPNLVAEAFGSGKAVKNYVDIFNLLPAPRISIIAPRNPAPDKGFTIKDGILTTTNQDITVTIEVTDMGGGIDELVLFHNGKVVDGTQRGFRPVPQTGKGDTKVFNISLVAGKNTLKATAFSIERTEAKPDEVVLNFVGTPVVKPNLYLLVIGINEYKNPKYNLNYAIADAKAVKEAIEGGGTSIFSSITSVFVTNNEALKPKIAAEFAKIKAAAKPEDVFIFYYAGHGVMSEEKTPQFYIVPHDILQLYGNDAGLQSAAVSAAELKQFSTQIKAQKQLFILDACQSGGALGALAARGAAEEKAINQLARSTGTYWLAASGTEQFAGEFAQLGHGLFTYCILQALSGKADGQNDRKITIQELSSYVNDQVPILSKQYKGTEQYPNSYGFGMDFPIVIVK